MPCSTWTRCLPDWVALRGAAGDIRQQRRRRHDLPGLTVTALHHIEFGPGLLHRVRVGPLTRAEDVERLRAQLKMNGLNPTPVKAD